VRVWHVGRYLKSKTRAWVAASFAAFVRLSEADGQLCLQVYQRRSFDCLSLLGSLLLCALKAWKELGEWKV